MNKFEAVLLYNPDLPTPTLTKTIDSFTKQITNLSGTIISTENWGIRDLSYNVNNYKKAHYNYYQIEIDANKIQDIKTSLTQNEQVIRHLFIKVEDHQKLPTKMLNEENKKESK